MITRVFGATARAALVVLAISIPALLLPNVSVSAQEITLIAGGLAAAFTLFEYASTHPGLIDFRFAPPYNRVRYFAFLAQILALTFLCRADSGIIEFDGRFERLAAYAVSVTGFPLSPVAFILAQVPPEAGAGFTRLVEAIVSVSLLCSVLLMIAFGFLLWLLKWPVGRRDFNLWINLPTFAPGYSADAERRLHRDGFLNLFIGLISLYAVPMIALPFVDMASDDFQSNYQLILWSAMFWGVIPGSLIIRGMAVIKVWLLVRSARLK